MGDTVFVFGAGFSSPAKIPTQNEIMKGIPDELRTRSFYKNVVRLYKNLFGVSENDLWRIPLEDIFTFLDRSISGREDTNRLDVSEIWDSHDSLRKLVSMILNKRLRDFAANDLFKKERGIYRSFFTKLINERMEEQDADPFSIISLNWDTIPEYFINGISKFRRYDRVRVDYTCYDYGYQHSAHVPSIYLKVKHYFNIKMAKIHGSVNWGYCSSCGRLYVKYNRDMPPVFYEMQDAVCRNCTRTKLRRLMITPTFMKDLNNTHLRMTWHNALMDIQQASRIVFLGYSFPLADFEFRYILTKAIAGSSDRRSKKIRVVLYPPDGLIDGRSDRGKQMRWEREAQEKRYRDFFGQLDYESEYMDVLDFMIDDHLIWNW